MFALSFACNNYANAQRTRYDFNSGWKLHVGDINEAKKVNFDDSDWRDITLPYAWNQDEAFKKDIVDLSTLYPEENVVAVRTDNRWDYKERFYDQSYQWSDKNFNANYGGIPNFQQVPE